MTKLQPCPFCGGEANCNNMGLVDHENQPLWWVVCLNCKVSTHGDMTKEAAMTVWNRRVDCWISVDERLPKTDDANKETKQALVYIVGDTDNCMSAIPWYFVKNDKRVTHWQPLPEGPKGADDGR